MAVIQAYLRYRALDALWRAKDKDLRTEDEILDAVRYGLRRTREHRTSMLRWIGNKYIWGESPQHPYAIEIMYHDADFSGERADPFLLALLCITA